MAKFLILDSNKKSYAPPAFVECALVEPESELWPSDIFTGVGANTALAGSQHGFKLWGDTARTKLLGVLISGFLKSESGVVISPDGPITEAPQASQE